MIIQTCGVIEMTDSNSSGGSFTGKVLTLGTLVAGGYHGFCDAQGMPFDPAGLENALTWGPMAVRGVYAGSIGAIAGIIGGAAVGANESRYMPPIGKYAAGGSLVGGAIGGTFGAALAGFQTLIGYGAGYIVGALAR